MRPSSRHVAWAFPSPPRDSARDPRREGSPLPRTRVPAVHPENDRGSHLPPPISILAYEPGLKKRVGKEA
ncbi:hypothetical protein BHE74_00011052 [Ensete ventricosum]|nr:hypothetical protein BHE74_00011052 [Ensete ventricosum]